MLRKLSRDPACESGTCPTLWATEDGAHDVVQGYVERLAQLDLPAGESAVMETYFRAQR
jgi:hypothetical protein